MTSAAPPEAAPPALRQRPPKPRRDSHFRYARFALSRDDYGDLALLGRIERLPWNHLTMRLWREWMNLAPAERKDALDGFRAVNPTQGRDISVRIEPEIHFGMQIYIIDANRHRDRSPLRENAALAIVWRGLRDRYRPTIDVHRRRFAAAEAPPLVTPPTASATR